MFGLGRISVVLRPGSEGQRFKPQAELDAVARVLVVGWLLAQDLLARAVDESIACSGADAIGGDAVDGVAPNALVLNPA
jgi:hypothetical protein